MEDKDILKELKEMSDSLPIPEELSADNMFKNLSYINYNKEIRKRRENRKIAKICITFASIAAVIALFIISLNTIGIMGIVYSEGSFTAKSDIIKMNTHENGFTTLKDYKYLEKYISCSKIANKLNSFSLATFATKESAPRAILGPSDYIDTELRTNNVKEADVVVTNGEYIFISSGCERLVDCYFSSIQIFKADEADSKLISNIELKDYIGEDAVIREMYIYDNILIVFSRNSKDIFNTFFFDISNAETPILESLLKTDGMYTTSRIHDGYLYTISKKSFSMYDEDIYPKVNGTVIDSDNVYIGNIKEFTQNEYSYDIDASYFIITGLSLSELSNYSSAIAVLSNDDQEYYVSTESIYMYYDYYENEAPSYERNTNIMKFSYGEGVISPDVTTTVAGYLDDTFCLDEYNDYLRLVVTIEKGGMTNSSLYILDGDLKTISTIEDIAEGEVVYSALFMQDIAYFVTYERRIATDPLFSVDLSDPCNPVILGSLILPGYSDYMHKWTDDLLIGFGFIGNTNANKLSLFDVSNPSDLKEVDTISEDEGYKLYSLNPDYYKSKLISYEKNLIGFFCGKYLGNEGALYYNLYSIENKQFKLVKCMQVEVKDYIQELSYFIRGIYIDGYIYIVVPDNEVIIYDLSNDSIVGNVGL